MTRLETVRLYFIERFFQSLAGDPSLAGLTQPAAVFSAPGVIGLTPDVAGFKQVPTPAELRSLIQAAPAVTRLQLETFLAAVVAAVNQIVGGWGEIPAKWGEDLANAYFPVVKHASTQQFLPVALEDFLRFSDGVLRGQLFGTGGAIQLANGLLSAMFENPEVVAAIPSANPYAAKVPFVSTVGITPTSPAFPGIPLSVGRLNLSAADPRFGPAQMAPTVYAEAKLLLGSIALNRAYDTAAKSGGRFAGMRNNRIHEDPLLMPTPQAQSIVAGFPVHALATSSRGAPLIPTEGPAMLVYHLLYPLDDEARKRNTMDATNREGHHLAIGFYFDSPRSPASRAKAAEWDPKFVFLGRGPDLVQVFPYWHPALERAGAGNANQLVLYSDWHSPLGVSNESIGQWIGSALGKIGAKLANMGPAYAAGFSVLAAIAIGGFASGAWPVGLAALALLLILFLICIFTDCGRSQPDLNADGSGPASLATALVSPPSVLPQYQDPDTFLVPENSGLPGRPTKLRLVPHMIDKNLYGLEGGGPGTFQVNDDKGVQDLLAWLAFPCGVGYQLERSFPGKQDVAGSSLRDYFTLFTEKLLAVRQAQQQVTYFAAP